MALWDPALPCPLCGRAIGDNKRLVIGFTCLGSYDADVSVVDDAVVHRACLNGWERRDSFVSAWNAEAAQNDPDNRHFLHVSSAGYVEYSNT
jgi:hypothetical protein